ncbi:MAG: DUF5131 family protein [Chitinophagaceae bacterium]
MFDKTYSLHSWRYPQIIQPKTSDTIIFGRRMGPGACPLDPAWVTDIRDQCLRAKVPFFKQWGGV